MTDIYVELGGKKAIAWSLEVARLVPNSRE